MSIWTENSLAPEFEILRGDRKTGVLIIGGGIAGLLCAYELHNAGVDYMLVEAKRICMGITKNTTAKITAQHGLIYNKLIKRFDTFTARMYLQANKQAVRRYAELCENIDCDFEIKDSYIYSNDIKKIEKELEALSTIGYNSPLVKDLPLPVKTAGAVKFSGQAQFNPLKFLFAIAKDLNIYENTKVRQLIGNVAEYNDGKIYADNIIVASHFPFINKHGSYFLKMYQSRAHTAAIKNAPDLNGMYMDADDKGLSFRNYKDMLIIAGGAHRTGKCTGGEERIKSLAKMYYPASVPLCSWSTQDCMTLDGIPYIGRYSANTDRMYVITGFNKWGMTSAMIAAEVICDTILGKENEYAHIFSPSRSILRTQLAVNAAESTAGLLTPSGKRCPHLGCALKWNKEEHSWDCPCHGSRFDRSGQVINNPATDDLKKK